MTRLSSISCVGNRSKKTTVTAFQTLIATKAPWGRYSADSWVSGTNTLTDLTGNGRNATTSGVTSGTAAGNGATASIPYLAGSPTATILWPSGSIPVAYTICSITRYSGANQERILTSTAGNFMHGHHTNARGISFDGAWKTVQTNTGTLLNWLNLCVSTGGFTPSNVLIDGNSAGTAVGGGGTALTLSINLYSAEKSDFQFSQLLIWNQVLSTTELATVAAALNTYLSTGALQ